MNADPVEIAGRAAALIRQGRHADAGTLLDGAIAAHPGVAMLRVAMCAALHRQHQLAEIEPHARQAMTLGADDGALMHQLGVILIQAGRSDLAVDALRAHADARPDDPRAWCSLAEGLFAADRFVPAAEAARRGLALAPGDPLLTHWLAESLRESGEVESAVDGFGAKLSRDPTDFNTASRVCFALHCVADAQPEVVLGAHRRYGEILRSMSPPVSPFRPARMPGSGPIRLGIVSADLRGHSVGSFVGPLITNVNRSIASITCFSIGEPDAQSARFARTADAWFQGSLDDPMALGRLITDADIHVLVELGGHTQGCVLPLLALRLAPIQATYLGYPGTTGTPNVDFRIVDAITDPPGAERWCTERLVRMEGCFVCYTPPDGAPLPGPLTPAGRAPAFGSFNALRKINDRVLDAWSRILNQCPGWRLVVKAMGLHDGPTAARLINGLAARGIAPSRIDARGWIGDRHDHFAAYHDIDIALDSFPYNGTTTTCEALWMGVPVVSFAGSSHAGRVGASLLCAAGLERLLAPDVDGYVGLAVALAQSPAMLAGVRAGLRERVGSSMLCDANGVAHRFEQALLAMLGRGIGMPEVEVRSRDSASQRAPR